MLRISPILSLCIFLNCSFPDRQSPPISNFNSIPKGALLTTNYKSFEEFRKVVTIEYSTKASRPEVKLTHSSNGGSVKSVLKSGVSEADFIAAKEGGFWTKVKLGLTSPYFVANRKDLSRVYFLSRRRHKDFGWPDKAFFDLAESMKNNISKQDLSAASPDDLSEKGYINTFNHIIAQSLMTTLFSESLADFVADTHERKTMPELITGDFTQEQLEDIKYGVVDNYVDIINNEWGQELGKYLKQKYKIDRNTTWSADLLANYLNEFQSYFSRVFEIRFKPFTSEDMLIKKYSEKINRVIEDVSGMW